MKHRVKVFEVEKPAPINRLNSHASPSPVIEDGRVYVHFGTSGTACLDTATAKILWTRRDVNLDHQEGAGSSPVLFGDLLIFHCDGRDRQYIAALNKKTGKTAWQVERSIDLTKTPSHARKAFSTPLVVGSDKAPVLISPAAQGCYAYDPRDGRELWHLKYKGFSAVPRPVASDGLVYVVTDFARPHLLAVRPNGRGDVTKTHVTWTATAQMPSTPSPAIADGLIYTVTDKGGVACCLDAKTGKLHWRHRLGGNFSASPIVAGERVYFFDREGNTTVMQRGRQAKVLGVNRLATGLMASPTVVGDNLYLRTRTGLYRIEATGR
jgi:outer membrane protein assembly factor BamB